MLAPKVNRTEGVGVVGALGAGVGTTVGAVVESETLDFAGTIVGFLVVPVVAVTRAAMCATAFSVEFAWWWTTGVGTTVRVVAFGTAVVTTTVVVVAIVVLGVVAITVRTWTGKEGVVPTEPDTANEGSAKAIVLPATNVTSELTNTERRTIGRRCEPSSVVGKLTSCPCVEFSMTPVSKTRIKSPSKETQFHPNSQNQGIIEVWTKMPADNESHVYRPRQELNSSKWPNFGAK